jgi:hypothetical protein
MVNILGTPCYTEKVLNIVTKQLQFKIVYKELKQGLFELLNAVNSQPVKCI